MNRHNLPLAWHAATDMSAIGWGYDCMQFKLFHKPRVAGSIAEGDSLINATLLYYVLAFTNHPCLSVITLPEAIRGR